MGKTNGITKGDLELLYNKRGLTTYEIAEIFNCCQATIWKKLHKFGIKPRNAFSRYTNVPSKKRLAELYADKKLSTWKIEERYGYSRGTVHRKLREYGIKTRSRAKAHIIFPRKDFSGDLEEKAHLIGFKLGDLRARKSYDNSETIRVDCGSTKAEQINLIHNLFSKYGNVWISRPNKAGKRQIEAQLNLTFSFLLDRTAPEWIFNDKKYFFPFLAGFTDAEGCISINNGMAYFSLGNYDKELLTDIKNCLNRLGIHCNDLTLGLRKGYVSKDGYVRNGDYWSLKISRKPDLLNLFEQIEGYIKHDKRIKDLSRAKRNIMERNKKFGNINMFPKGGDSCA